MLNSLNSENRIDFYKKIWGVATIYHQPFTIRTLIRKAKFLLIANKNREQIDNFVKRVTSQSVDVTAPMIGLLEWPYLHNNWDIQTKLDKVATHYEILSKSYPKLTKLNEKPFELISFDHISKGVVVALDYSQWFIREGELVLNIFQNELRVASMAFILDRFDGEVVAYIGAVQGIHSGVSTEESLEIYKVLTKDFEGLRPRSLLLEVLKVLLTQIGVKKLFAISEQHRHHRHKYFHHDDKTVFKNDYNPFWEEHEGVPCDGGFYALPLKLSIKDMAEIPSKKRSMYRRRYEIVDYMKNNINLQDHS
jgi:uncharacterized protein VirK/YbjX